MTEQTLDRTKMIGSSDIAKIMGMSRFGTPLGVWAEKTGKVKVDLSDVEAVEWGTRLEEVVAVKFAEKNKVKLMAYKKRFAHDTHPYLSCELDRIIVGTDEIVEVKTVSAYKWKEFEDANEIPQEFILQVIFAMGISKRKTAHIAILCGGQRYIERKVKFDQDLFDKLVTAAVDFWENFVQTDTQPMAIAGDSGTLFELFPDSDIDASVTWDGDEEIDVNQMLDSRSAGITAKKEIQLEIDDLDAKLKQKLGTAEKGRTGQYTVTWKTQHRKEYVVAEKSMRVLRTKSNAREK